MIPRHDLSFCACTRAYIAPELLVSMGSSTHLWFCKQNSDFWIRITSFYVYQSSPVVLCMQISVISTRITSPYGFKPSSVVLRIQNSDFKTKIACVYGSQNSLVIFCMQNSVNSIRITSLYGSQHSSVSFACKTATFGPELQVSVCIRLHLSFCACKSEWLKPE